MAKVNLNTRGQRGVAFNAENVRQGANYTWFRGEHCNFNPASQDMTSSDTIRRHVLSGWAPEEPHIGADTKIVAFGSCFAANITDWLSERNFNVVTRKDGPDADTYLVRFGEGLVNSFAIRQQFEWALKGKVFLEELWHGYDGKAFGYDGGLRRQTQGLIMKGDVFIITLGLSEIWYDEVSGEAFWRAVPREKYDPTRHKFRVSTVAENKDNIAAIIQMIREVRPEAKIILTLSPIPLVATFRSISCITANAESKAILRTAIAEVLREAASPSLFYWPSYEMVMHGFRNSWTEDRRHVQRPVLDFIMTLFETTWCQGSVPRMTVAQAWLRACAAAGMVPSGLPEVIEQQNIEKLQGFAPKDKARGGAAIAMAMDRVKEIAAADPSGPLAQWVKDQPKDTAEIPMPAEAMA